MLGRLLSLLLVAALFRPSDEEGYVCPPCGASCHDAIEQHVSEAPGTCIDCGMALVPSDDVAIVLTLVTDRTSLMSVALPMGLLDVAEVGHLRTVSDSTDELRASRMLTITPDYDFESAPLPDVLIVPHCHPDVIEDDLVGDWVRRAAAQAEIVIGIAGGNLLLARVGLLAGQPIPAHAWWSSRLTELAPATERSEEAYVAAGKYLLALDEAAAQTATLEAVRRLGGDAKVERTLLRTGFGRSDRDGQPEQERDEEDES